jgi:hypothetical protein
VLARARGKESGELAVVWEERVIVAASFVEYVHCTLETVW